MSLRDYGWIPFFSEPFDALNDPGLRAARVIAASSGKFRLMTGAGEVPATLAGRLRHDASSAAGASVFPAVGDWVAISAADAHSSRIDHVLPRRTKLSRKVAGRRSEEQVVAANVDTVLIMMALDGDFSVRRLERYLTTVRQSGARPVLLLNKLDLCQDPPGHLEEVERIAGGASIQMMSCLEGASVEAVLEHILPRETAVLVGSSGVGKSTLINRLLGTAIQKTQEVRRKDSTGRHTTTHRELFRLPGGGLLIDSPGIREMQLWSTEETLEESFNDIAQLALTCRYRNCSHEKEPGCAVKQAEASGALAPGRLEAHRALLKETRHLEVRQDAAAKSARNKKWRAVHRELNSMQKRRGR